jgi:DNA primase
LFETDEGNDIGLAYLKERGFREDIIRKFQLGYSPNKEMRSPKKRWRNSSPLNFW